MDDDDDDDDDDGQCTSISIMYFGLNRRIDSFSSLKV